MKVISFLKWKIKQATFADWLWAVASFIIGVGIVRLETDGKYFILAGVTTWVLIIFFDIVIKGIKRDYQKFTNEQNELFNTIKHSDKNDH